MIIIENLPNVGELIVNQIQELQRVPYRINQRRNIPRHILIKVTKIKHKEKILKTAKEKQEVTYNRSLICLTVDVSAEMSAGQKGMARHI